MIAVPVERRPDVPNNSAPWTSPPVAHPWIGPSESCPIGLEFGIDACDDGLHRFPVHRGNWWPSRPEDMTCARPVYGEGDVGHGK